MAREGALARLRIMWFERCCVRNFGQLCAARRPTSAAPLAGWLVSLWPLAKIFRGNRDASLANRSISLPSERAGESTMTALHCP